MTIISLPVPATPIVNGAACSLPALIDRARTRLAEARTSAEILEVRAAAKAALHYAKLLEAAYGEEAFAAALRDWCCGKMTVQAAAIAHGVSESTLYRARKRLYEAW